VAQWTSHPPHKQQTRVRIPLGYKVLVTVMLLCTVDLICIVCVFKRSEKIFKKFAQSRHPGTDVMIYQIFLPKSSAKKMTFLTQNKAKLCKILIIALVLRKTPIFSPKIVENRRKL
jgi:hypothetical protein